MIAYVQCCVRRPAASALLLACHAGRLWPCSRCSRLGLLGALEMRCCFLPSARFFPLAEARRLCPHQSHHHLHHHHDHHRLQLVLGGLMHPPHHLQPFCFFAFLSLSLFSIASLSRPAISRSASQPAGRPRSTVQPAGRLINEPTTVGCCCYYYYY